MKRSTDRILTSHAGSLHRPEDLRQTMAARRDDEPFDVALTQRVKQAVKDVVRLQAENGVDIVNDGEYTKGLGLGWMTYARQRLGGIEIRPLSPSERAGNQSITAREERVFPEYFEASRAQFGGAGGFARTAVYANGPLTYVGQADTKRDIDYLKEAMQGAQVEEGFLSALAPGTIEHWLRNDYYKGGEEEFLFAIAEAMREEYKAIIDAGLVLQIDDPDLPDGWQMFPEMSVADYRKYAQLRVDALNHALRDLPEDQIRLHVCWGSGHGPHTHDIPLKDIVDIVFSVRAGSYSIEASNAMHEWEWVIFEDFKLPDGKTLVPGVVGHSSHFVEHPELVAQRLVRYANLVGRENVLAGTDCGLGGRVAHPKIAWAKFRAMSEGARLASQRLWAK